MDENEWSTIRDLPKDQQQKVRYLVRNALDNGIVAAGVAVRFGNEWRVNRTKLPTFLAELTLRTLERERQNPQAKRRAHTLNRRA
jgi:hypothetical protein